MKRRDFLKLVGCAVAVPALPKVVTYRRDSRYEWVEQIHYYDTSTGQKLDKPVTHYIIGEPIRYPSCDQERQLKSRIHCVIN